MYLAEIGFWSLPSFKNAFVHNHIDVKICIPDLRKTGVEDPDPEACF